VRPEWFQTSDTVGITAGTSTPDSVIAEVEQQIMNLAKEQYEKCMAGAVSGVI
jgi:4-hydroxy-3-methylbut-2-enyl diphosphate reductase IspH